MSDYLKQQRGQHNKLYKTLKFVKKINNDNPITFFEITTVAYLYTKEQNLIFNS